MSSWFKNRKVGDRILHPIPASSFDSSTERTSGASSSDESDDTRDRFDTSGSSENDRDRNNNEKQFISRAIDLSDGENDKSTKTKVSNRKLELPAIEELAISSRFDLELLPKLEDLTLNSDCESLNKIADLSLNYDQRPLAGVVTSVAKVIGLIVVKPPKPHDVLLYIGSPLFLSESNLNLVSKDLKLGWVIDVFGPACEPYYCVKPVNNCIELVHEGSELFYSPDHPRTAFLCLKLENNNRYTVRYSTTFPLLDNRQKFSGQTSEEDFWRTTSRDDSPHRRTYRRRRRNSGNNYREAAAYRNKYRKDQYSFAAINRQPKHSYFDY